jgi:hypothetical protein
VQASPTEGQQLRKVRLHQRSENASRTVDDGSHAIHPQGFV